MPLLELLERSQQCCSGFAGNSALGRARGRGCSSRGAHPARGAFTFQGDQFQAWMLHLKVPGGEEAGAGPWVGGRGGSSLEFSSAHSEHISSLFPSFDEGTAEFISQQAMEEGGKSEGSCSRSSLNSRLSTDSLELIQGASPAAPKSQGLEVIPWERRTPGPT